MTVGTFAQPDFESDTGTEYKTNLDNCIAALSRIGANFAPHEQSAPNMTVRVDAGSVWVSGVLTEKAAQDSATITAPSSNPRIDRVVKDSQTGVVSVVTGEEAASPLPPDIPAGKEPVCQILLQTTTTAIDNTMITDERVPGEELPASTAADDFLVGNGTTFVKKTLAETRAILTEVPTGIIMAYGGSEAPSGFLLCNGGAVSRTTYAALFAILGTAYGSGDGSTTFNLPNLCQRFPLGKAASGTGATLGASGGAIDHTHSMAGGTCSLTPYADSNIVSAGPANGYLSTGTVDGVTAANNPPYQVVNYIIKY